MELELAELYLTTLGRAPDAEGLDFWIKATQDGVTIDEIRANWFSSQEEVINKFDGLSNEHFIGLSYLNAFGRLADEEGRQYWGGLLEDGTLSRESFGQALVLSAKTVTGSPSDAIALSNRTEVGLLYAKLDGVSDMPVTDIVTLVTSDESTVILAEAVLSLISATRTGNGSSDDFIYEDFMYANSVIGSLYLNTLVDPVKVKDMADYITFVTESVALTPASAVSTVFLEIAYALDDFENNLLNFGDIENLAKATVYSLWNQGALDSSFMDSELIDQIGLPITDLEHRAFFENSKQINGPRHIGFSHGYEFMVAQHIYLHGRPMWEIVLRNLD